MRPGSRPQCGCSEPTAAEAAPEAESLWCPRRVPAPPGPPHLRRLPARSAARLQIWRGAGPPAHCGAAAPALQLQRPLASLGHGCCCHLRCLLRRIELHHQVLLLQRPMKTTRPETKICMPGRMTGSQRGPPSQQRAALVPVVPSVAPPSHAVYQLLLHRWGSSGSQINSQWLASPGWPPHCLPRRSHSVLGTMSH